MNIQQNNTSFGSLRSITYRDGFAPQIIKEHNMLIDTLKESKSFGKFFEKNDGIAIFDNFLNGQKQECTVLTLRYNSKNRNIFSRLGDLILPEYEKYKKEVSIYAEDFFCSGSARKLLDKIKTTSFENLTKIAEEQNGKTKKYARYN